MSSIKLCRSVWLVVILLPFLAGGIQRKSYIGALSVADQWDFFEEDQQLYLIGPEATSRQRLDRKIQIEVRLGDQCADSAMRVVRSVSGG